MRNLSKLGGFLVVLLTLLTFSLPVMAQITPTPAASPSAPPNWFKDIPLYNGWQKISVEDSTLSAVGIKRSEFYVEAGTSLDPVTTIADFYASKLEAAGWQVTRQPLGKPDFAQQLTFSDPQTPAKELIVLVASQPALLAVPSFRALASQVSEKQTLIALAARLSSAAATSESETLPDDLLEPPAWFKSLPFYAGSKKITLNNNLLKALGGNRANYFSEAMLTSDSITQVVEFYDKNFRERSWAAPVKTDFLKDNLGQLLIYRGGNLILLVVGKEGLNSLPPLKTLAAQVPDGQTLVALITPVELPPVSGTRCMASQVCQVGAYKIKVTFDRDSFNTTDPVLATLERLDKTSSSWELKAEIVPSTSTAASVVNFKGDFEQGTAAVRKVKLDFPISGNWFVAMAVKGEAGEAKFYITHEVEPPPLMDARLAWALGLSPILGLIGFAIGQWRLVVRRQREEALAETPTAPSSSEVSDKELAGRN